MAAEKTNKTRKRELETYRPTGWLSPFERMDDMFDEFIRRPFGRPLLSRFPRIKEKIEEKNYYHHERSYGSFKRSFNLPAEVQSDKAKASFKHGVLEVRIPKT